VHSWLDDSDRGVDEHYEGDHLIEQGHTRILIVSKVSSSTSKLRKEESLSSFLTMRKGTQPQ